MAAVTPKPPKINNKIKQVTVLAEITREPETKTNGEVGISITLKLEYSSIKHWHCDSIASGRLPVVISVKFDFL